MTSKSAPQDATLGEFELAGKPTSINDVDETAPPDVVEAFNSIKRFNSRVQINSQDSWLLVGRSTGRSPEGYRLFHRPESQDCSGFAGRLLHNREFNHDSPNDHTIVFEPAGDKPDAEVEVLPIAEITVEQHNRTERLNNVLNEIRTDLTDSDWTQDGRADTGYGEWVHAVNELADFIGNLDNRPEQFPARAVMESRIMHGIARYPLDAEKLLSQASDCLRENLDNGLYEASPEAFRTILLRYHKQELADKG